MRYVFDYKFGLTDKEVARLIHERKRPFDSPDDAPLAKIWMDRSPTHILADDYQLDALRLNGEKDIYNVQGTRFKIIQRFPLNRATDWVLAERLP